MKRFSLSAAVMTFAVLGMTIDANAGGSHGSYGSVGASSGGSYGGSTGGSVGGSYGSSGGLLGGSSGGSSGGITRREERLLDRAARRSASSGSHGSEGSSGGSYGSHGSSGGSYGSTGASHGSSGGSLGSSTGGSYGSHGSSGGSSGGPTRRDLRKIFRAASHGSSGGSSGGASSGGASSGGHASSGGGASSGGYSPSYGYSAAANRGAYAPVAAAPRAARTFASVQPKTPVAQPQAEQQFAYVVVTLPADATLYLGGNATTTTGSVRKFKIPVTDANRSYPYAVRAELKRDGQVFVASSTETLVAGKTLSVKVNDVASSVDVAAR